MHDRNGEYEAVDLGRRIHDQRAAVQFRQRTRQRQADARSGDYVFSVAVLHEWLEDLVPHSLRHDRSVVYDRNTEAGGIVLDGHFQPGV